MFDNLENNFDPNLDQSVNNKSYWLSQPSTSALLLPKTCFRIRGSKKHELKYSIYWYFPSQVRACWDLPCFIY